MDCQSGSAIDPLDGKKAQGMREGGGDLRGRDEKRLQRKKYHLFFRDNEDKNVSIGLGCERSPDSAATKLQGAQRGKEERADRRKVDRWKTGK